MTVGMETQVASIAYQNVIFIKPTFTDRAYILLQRILFINSVFLVQIFLRSLTSVVLAIDYELGVHKQAVGELGTEVVVSLITILDETP